MTAPSAPAKIIRILFDDRPIPLIDHAHWKLTLPSGSDPTKMAARFKVVLATTCFDEPIEVTSVSAEGQLEGKWPVPATVYVDREGVGSAVSVSIGSLVVDGSEAKVLVGSCPNARDVRIDDAIVGELGASTIVDAKGGHCYEVITGGSPGARLEGKRLYQHALDLFLPPEIPIEKTALRRCEHGSASLTELLGGQAAPPPTTGVFTANPLSRSKAPPPPPKTTPRKPRH